MKPVACHVTEVVEKKAIMVTFPNGELLSEAAHTLKCGMYKDKKTGKHVVEVRDGDYELNGHEISNENDIVQNFLAIRNKKTNQMKIIPLQCYSLSPVTEEDVGDIISELTSEDLHKLGIKFGSKHMQRSLEHYVKMRTDKETLENKLKLISENVTVDTSVLDGNANTVSQVYLPPIDRNAATVEEVYKLNDILTLDEQEILKKEAINIMTHPDCYKKEDFTDFFWQCLAKLSVLDKDKVLRGVTISLYADLLVKFLCTNSKVIGSKQYCACKFSKEINKKIMSDFTVQAGNLRSRPLTMRDKGICYLIVVALIANSYNLELPPLAAAIRMPVRRLYYYCTLVSAVGTSTKNSSQTAVVLKLPLPEPRSDKPISKKRKKQ